MTKKGCMILLAVMFVGTLIAGCTAPSGPTSLTPTVTPTVTPTASPTMMLPTPILTITAPSDGASLPMGNITVSVQVSNFDLVALYGKANVSGQGHIHYYMDVAVPTTPGKPAVTAPGTFAPVIATNYTWTNVTAGTHNFSVQLVNNDHSPIIPLVYKTVTVTITGSVPQTNMTTVPPTTTTKSSSGY